MVPVGGYGAMATGALLAAGVLVPLAALLRPWLGVRAWLAAAFLWSLVVVALVTLMPTVADPGVVYAEDRLGYCSTDIGGPAPDGFWIFDGAQRTLNTALFVLPGFLWALLAALSRAWWVLLPVGAVLLTAASGTIELLQLEVARIDRACDLTDVVDNVTGAAIGLAAGIVVGAVSGLLRLSRRRARAR